MALASGLGSQMGISIPESTYGTVVTPTRFYEFDSEAFNRQPTYVESVGLKANRTFQPSARVVATTRQAGGSLPMDVPTKQFGTLLNMMHGLTVTPVQQAATAAYKQTHLIGTSQPNRSATIQFNKPDTTPTDRAFTYPGSVLTGVSFDCAVGGLLKTTLTYDAQDELTSVSTPTGPALATASYATNIESFNHTQGVVTIGGSNVAVVKSFSLAWSQPYKTDRWFMGSGGTKAKPIPNGFATVSGNLTLEFADIASYTLFVSGAMSTAVFNFTGSLIASTYYNNITFTLDKMQYRGDSPNVAGPDVLELNAPIMAFDGGTNPPLQIDYTSTDTTLP